MPLSDKKRQYGSRLVEYVENYKSCFVVHCDNVGSKQMQQVRVSLRGTAAVIMGKNVRTRTRSRAVPHVFLRLLVVFCRCTGIRCFDAHVGRALTTPCACIRGPLPRNVLQTTIRKVLRDFLKKNEGHPIEALLEHVVGNVGLIFTNTDLAKVRDVVVANKVPAPARVGSVAPVDVFVEPGPTGCDPGQTTWFQALNIPTKINKGQIEMISRVHLITAGNRVTDSQAALLQKLNIKPFTYGLVPIKVYDNGSVFDVKVLDINETDLLAKFFGGVGVLAALSMELGLPNKASITHSINNAYKALLAIGMETDYKFKAAAEFENFAANAASFVAAAPAAGGAAPAGGAAAAKKEEPEEEEEVGGAGGLFGDDDDF